MATKRRPPAGGLQALRDRYIGDDPEKNASLDRARADADVAQMIYDLRTGAGLSQRQLAALVGTDASVICRLEDADYEGHSLSMLRRIATALGRRVQVRFVPLKRDKPPRMKAMPAGGGVSVRRDRDDVTHHREDATVSLRTEGGVTGRRHIKTNK